MRTLGGAAAIALSMLVACGGEAFTTSVELARVDGGRGLGQEVVESDAGDVDSKGTPPPGPAAFDASEKDAELDAAADASDAGVVDELLDAAAAADVPDASRVEPDTGPPACFDGACPTCINSVINATSPCCTLSGVCGCKTPVGICR